MIGKEIENRKQSSSKAGRTGGLAKYITNPEATNSLEKCTYSNSLGFISKTQSGKIAEMIGLSQEAVRSKDTIKHYIFSWKEGEHPSNSQVDDSVNILLKETGLKGHQAIYGLHQDTDNIHLHIMVNRVHPHTLKLVEINNGFDIESIHKAVALIEHKQGWSREVNGRYFVLENGDVCRLHVEIEIARHPGQKQRDREYRTGEKSGQRIAIDVAVPIIKNAKSWEQLHSELARHGVTYQPAGKGAVVSIAGVNIKASAVSPAASFHKLQRRLGVYQPPMYTHEQSINVLQPLSAEAPGWDAYLIQKKEYEEAKNKQDQMRQRHKHEMQALKNQQSNDRNDLLSVGWVGRRDVLNALRSVMSEDHAEARKALRVQQKEELRQLSAPFPEWQEWRHAKVKIKAVSQPESKSKSTVEVSMDDDGETQNVYLQETSELQKQFAKYHAAIQADSYRVTCVRKFQDGSQAVFLLAEGQQGIKGFTPRELEQHELGVQGIQKKGGVLQYTPISAHKHHILIDQISQESLDRLQHNGYKPAIVLKSAPDRFQAIITIPKLETPFDDQVGHVLTFFFNREYGDPERKCIGSVYPHVAPGSVVHLRENSNNVADTHVATLIRAECCECVKTQSLAAVILEELQPKQELKGQDPQQDQQVPAKILAVDVKAEPVKPRLSPQNLQAISLQVEPPTTSKNPEPGMS